MELEKEGELCEEKALGDQYSYIFYKMRLVYNCNTKNTAKKSQLF